MEPGSVSPMLAALGNPPTRYADFSVEAKYDGEPGLAIAEMVSFETLVISHLTAVVAPPWLTIGAFRALGDGAVIICRLGTCGDIANTDC